MSKIDEIKRALETCERRPDRMNFAALELMIAAALEDARREGAEAMREDAAMAVNGVVIPGYIESASCRIRALSLPTGERQAVLLTDEQIARALHATTGDPEDGVDFSAWARHPDGAEFLELSRVVEALSLDANSLEVRRG